MSPPADDHGTGPDAAGGAARVVLDTNVCLDLFVFDDPRVARLRDALAAGAVVAVADAHTRREWARVLGYPGLRLDGTRQAAALAAFDDAVHVIGDADGEVPARSAPAVALPRCRDPDDQMFVALVRASGARWLLSRDLALLELTRRLQRSDDCEVVTPEAWPIAAG